MTAGVLRRTGSQIAAGAGTSSDARKLELGQRSRRRIEHLEIAYTTLARPRLYPNSDTSPHTPLRNCQ